MNAEDSLKLARRFIGLPLEKRQLFLQALQKEGVDFSRFPIPAGVEVEDRQALSYAQQRMWFLWQLDRASGAYNLPGAVRLKGALNFGAMEQAFASLVGRHETLRTVFQRQADDRLAQVAVEPSLAIDQLDLSTLTPAEREQAVIDAATRQSLLPFDLEHGPLLRVQLLKLDDQEHVLLLTLHHIVSDGWSMNVLIDEFIRFYDAHERNETPQLPALPIQYSDYALWQRRWLEAGEQARQLEYWQARLGDEHPVLELPTDRARPAMPSYQGTRHNFAIDPSLAAQLRSCAQKHNVTLFMLLLGAFNVLLHRYTGQGDIRIGVPIANRNRSEVEGLIGFFVNTQVLRTELTGQTRVSELLQGIKEHALGAQAHQELPFERLVEALKVERSLSHTPLFQVMYNHQPVVADIASVSTASGLELVAVEWQGRTTQFDLTLDTYEKSGTLHAALTFANDLFDAPSIERMAQHWISLLHAMVADAEQRVGELPMLNADEQRVLVRDWNQTAESYPAQRPIHHLIEQQVQRTPQAPALVFGSSTLTYAQLDARANQLANFLREKGVGPDVLVGICVERSIEMVVGLLAIIKAGGAYVPLDPEYPEDRLAYMIEDSGIELLLTQQSLQASLPSQAIEVIGLDRAGDWLSGFSTETPTVEVHALNLAYVIYTSGSTGKPKGAGNSHRALVNRLCWMQQAYGLDASDAVLQKTPFSFDVSVWEFFWPLMTGARLVVAAPGEHREPARLIDTIGRHAITTLHFVPSMLQAFIHEPGVQACASLKRIVCSGEALPLDAQLQVFAKLPGAGLYNLYGPTEAAIDVTHWTCVDEGADSVPIGRPIANLATYVLDAQLNPVPAGVSGELYLGGTGLARSYHRRPALTAERFVPSPFIAGERLYRTGDRVCQRADGVIEYLGRLDHQVKLRGLRIELGEIETRLMQHPTVREAVVLVQGGKQLVAYLVLESDEPADLKAWLLKSLPEYMVPTHLITLAKLPVTANGKLDRKALPLPDAAPQQGFVAPQNDLQKALAAIWSDVLGVEQVGLEDNFFELGGDSIISIQVVSRARQAGIRLNPRDLFQYQSIRSLALVATFEQTSVIDQGPVSGDVILTPVQHSFFAQVIPARQHWNQSLLLTPRETLEPVRLEAALTQLINHHDALRLRFVQQAGEWQQAHAAPVTEAALWQSRAANDVQLAALCDEAQRSLDLAQGPLMRAVLVAMADGNQRLLLVVHHLVVDGVSWRILLEDLQQAYRQAPLPAKTSAYQHWAQQLQAHAGTLNAQLPFWQAQTVDADLPCDNPRGGLQNRLGSKLETRLGTEHTRQLLQDAPAAYRTQVNDLLLTALARVISRWSGQAAALIQLEGHGREDLFDAVDLTRTVGWFTSLFPLRLQAQGEWSDAIKSVKEQLRAVPDKGLGYGLLRYLAAPEVRETLETLPVPRITFNYLGQFDRQFNDSALFVPATQGSGQAQDPEAPLANWLTVEGQVYGGELALQWGFSREMFQASTIQRLADEYSAELKALIEHCCETPAGQVTPSDFPLARVTRQQLDQLPVAGPAIADLYPLSPMQQGMLFHTLYEPQAQAYINQLRLDIDGLDLLTFGRAWQAALDRHDILRSSFHWLGLDTAHQVIHRQVDLQLQVIEDPQADFDALADAERERGFELSAAPLFRLMLVRGSGATWHLIFTSHHILMDGWSNAQLLGEVLAHYSGQTLATPPGQFRDYLGWLQQQASGEAFWKAALAPLQAPTLLAEALRAPVEGAGMADYPVALDSAFTQALGDFARQHKITLNTVLQGAWSLLLQRYTGQACVAFGATVSGRSAPLPGIEQQLGLFINTLPIISAASPARLAGEWLGELQALNVSLRDHEHTPLFDIQGWAGQQGATLFDTLLVFENFPVAEALKQGAPAGLTFGKMHNHERTHYPLTLGIELGANLRLEFSYDCARFSAQQVAQLSANLQHVLMQLVANAQVPLGNLQLLDGSAQRDLLALSQTPRAVERALRVHERIAAQADATPDALAVQAGSERLTYAQLNQRANRLAHRLLEQGVGPGQRVGLAARRGPQLIVSLLAVLKSGAAYVPLDPKLPAERLAYMLADSRLSLLLGETGLLADLPLPQGLARVDFSASGEELAGYPTTNPPNHADRADLAYVIYTSGSTGQPKGVAIDHAALDQFCDTAAAYSALTPADRVLQFATFSFDGFVEQCYPPLCVGAALIMRGEDLWDAEWLAREIVEQGVTLADLPAAYWYLLAKECAASGRTLGNLRQVHVGGEAMAVEGVRAWHEAGLQGVRLLNTYGPTEATVVSSVHDCQLADAHDAYGMPIGRAIEGRALYVLDSGFELLPNCGVGELCIGASAGLAQGYFDRPALTAERFLPDPFSGVPGARLYRSGDLARYNERAVLEYVGRIDHQVKIRGFRIEMGEIEACLQALPEVREAAVLALDGPTGAQLVAYVVPHAESLDAQALAAVLRQSLPDYMVPAHWVVLQALPLNNNGKLDRRALPLPDMNESRARYVAPQTSLQHQLAGIWQAVLQVEPVGLEDHFFERGGHSLLATQVISRVRHELKREVPLRALFEQPTLRRFALACEGAQTLDTVPMVALKRGQPMALSSAQERQWFLWQLDPRSAAYHVPTALHLRGQLNRAALEQAFQALVQRHEALRTTFVEEDGRALQVIHSSLALVVETVSIEATAIDACVEQEIRRPFDLIRGPLMRVKLFAVQPDHHVLVITQHHIISDGWSMQIVVDELVRLYTGYCEDAPAPLAALPLQYADYAGWQRQWTAGDEHARQLAYWRDQLGGEQPVLALPLDFPRPAEQSYRGACLDFALPEELAQALQRLAQREHVTIFTLLLASFQMLLHRYSGQDDIRVGVPVANRNRLETEGLVGFFVNTQVLRAQFDGAPAFTQLLQQVHQSVLDAQSFQDLPFEQLVETLQPERSLSHSPLFQVLFNHQNRTTRTIELPALTIEGVAWDSATAQFDLTLETGEVQGGLAASLTYATDLFSADTIKRMAGHWQALLQAVVGKPDHRLGDLAMMSAVERQLILQDWNATAERYPLDASVQQLIETQVLKAPGAQALAFGETRLTYAELNTRANQLAHQLIAHGVGPDVLVGIAVERSIEMVVGLLAILKAGGAYVPFDPEYPQERLQYMIEDSGIGLLLTQQALLKHLPIPQGLQTLVLDQLNNTGFSSENPNVPVTGENLAYVIYTSGSTGKPKGAGNRHSALTNRLCWMQQAYQLGASDTVLQKTPFSFDVSVWEFFWPLMTGARLVVAAPGDHRDPAKLVELINREQVSTLHFVPSMLQAFLQDTGVSQCTSLTRIVCSGEALPADAQQQVFAKLPQANLYNLYGPTEAAIDVTHWTCVEEGRDSVPIGRPIANLSCYILDDNLEPAPVGVLGELYLGGEGLARGYHRRPSLTAERFAVSPFGHGERLYRTGDLARYRADGVIEYAGRIDHQVKLRGLRIELGEIEARLLEHVQVREAVVVVVDNALLAAYVVPVENGVLDVDSLKQHIAQALPGHMVPSHIQPLAQMPLSPNGKLDRKALPAFDTGVSQSAYVAPHTETQKQVAAIWQSVLGVDSVGLNDNFFALGGHSLLATQVTSRVRGLLGLDVPLKSLFEHGTLHAYVQSLAALSAQDTAPAISRIERNQPLGLSYAQERQWFLWQLDPHSAAYHIPTALRLRGRLDLGALQHAFDALIRRHEALRTHFVVDGERTLQVIRAPFALNIEVEPVAGNIGARGITALVEAEIARPFDLLAGPLLRVKLLQLAEDDHVLVLTQHHIVSDAASMQIVVAELIERYADCLQGDVDDAPELALDYVDYAQWQRNWMDAGERERQLAYWVGQLGGEQPVLELPLDHPRPAVQSYRGARLDLQVPQALSQGLQALARREGTTLYMLLLASFQTLLHRYSGQRDVRVGVPIANRNRVETESLIGFFVNTQVMRAEVDAQQPFSTLLQQVRHAALQAQAHQDLPFEQLVEALAPTRSLSHSPLFQVMFNHQASDARVSRARAVPGLSIQDVQWDSHTAQFDLTLDTHESADGVHASLTYATDLFEPGRIERMAQHWLALLQGIVDAPDRAVGELALLSAAEQQMILQDWNATAERYPLDASVQQLIETQVLKAPNAQALAFGETRLTYAELNARANQLAHQLIAHGVGPDVLVGIAVERSIEMVVGLLGILKAGGAYVPFDPEYPQERLQYMIEDSGIGLLLTQQALVSQLPVPQGLQTLVLDRLDSTGFSSENPAVPVSRENLAYVIYTSGSTGKPKGAGNRHSALTNRLCWMQQAYQLGASDTVLQKTPFSFDVSVWEFFWPLMTGARLVVAAPGDHRDPARLIELINREQVSTLHFVPSMLQAFLQDTGVAQCTSLTRIVCSGEALPADAQQQVFAKLPNANLYNLYGPTEAAIDVTHWTCVEEGRDSVPIGRPIANLGCYILDDNLEPVPVGVLGELYLGGEGLARGYHRRPSLTAERFAVSPFGHGERLYRTGDLARYRADGVIEYAGRIDHQVKLRGLRIELGEIEARLLEHEAVRETAVTVIDGKHLLAYVVLAETRDNWRETLSAYLQQSLPDYMVPNQWMLLEQLPLSPNGKLDRKALPKPDAAVQQAYVAPRSELEQRIASVWADVLRVEQVGVTDNFFELGGDSIISIQVVGRARQAGIHFTPKELFQYQTVQGLAAVARRGEPASTVDQGPVTGSLPLLPFQQWFFDSAMPEPHHWNQSVLLTSHEPMQAELIEQALQALVQHHDALRLRFSPTPAGWRAEHAPVEGGQPLLHQVTLQTRDEIAAACDAAQRSLDIQHGPLLRGLLIELADGTQRLLLVIHHLAVDGVSWRVLLEDLQQAYQGALSGNRVTLAAKTAAFKTWADRLQAHARSDALLGERAWWQAQLADADAQLPCKATEAMLRNNQARNVQVQLSRELTQRLLQQAPVAYRTQINDLLLTALTRVVGRWSGQASTLIQLEGHGREELFDDIDLSRTVGWFTTAFPVRLKPAPDLAGSIKQVKEQLRAIPNKGIGFGLLRYLADAETQRAFSELPAPRITFNYLGQLDRQFDDGALFTPATESGGNEQSPLAPLANWLVLNGQVYDGKFSLGWTFSDLLFDEATVKRLADDYIAELTGLIEHCSDAANSAVTPSDFPLAALSQAQLDALPVPCENIEDIYPLSPMQQGMLFHSLYQQGGGDYINQLRVSVRGLDAERFRTAWQDAVQHHESLRSGFIWAGEQQLPLQVVHRHVVVPFTVYDWQSREDLTEAVQQLAAMRREQGFDLQAAPLLRLDLVRSGPDSIELIYTSHHILMDGWSNSQLLGEVLQRYSGTPPGARTGRYGDYIAWLQRQDSVAGEHFWKEQLAALEEPTRLASTAHSAPPGQGYGDLYDLIDTQQTRRLGEFARRQKVTLNTVVQAAWSLLLQRRTGQSVVAFGATVAGRPADVPGALQQVGLFINTLPVMSGVSADCRVGDWLQGLQSLNLRLREYEHTPLFDIQRWAGQGGDALFDTLLVFENYPVSQALEQGAPAGLAFGQVHSQEQSNYPLTLAVGLEDSLSLHYSYDRQHFSAAAIEQVNAQLRQVLLQMLEVGAQGRVDAIDLLDEHTRQRILKDWNPSVATYMHTDCLHHLIERQVEKAPHAVALVCEGEQLTYGALNRRANRLAHALIAEGVGPEVLVGIAVERSFDMLVGLLAILKAGGAYVPLDPAYPQERLQYMIEDSGLTLLLTQAHLPGPDGVRRLLIDADYPAIEHNPQVAVGPQNLAYVIYTSGSTGKPKGTLLPHSNVLRLFQATEGWFDFGPQDCWSLFHSYAFDFSVWEIFGALLYGGRLLIVPQDVSRSPQAFFDLLCAEQVTVLNQTPSAFKQLMQVACAAEASRSTALRYVVFGGEALEVSSLRPWFERFGDAAPQLINMYGITETTVHVTYRPLSLADLDNGVSSPIGVAIPDLSWYVLDRDLNPVPAGCTGELYVGGAGLARGYLHRGDLSSTRFIPNLFSAAGERLYRTGDLARYGADGVIEYVGRIDHQVKIRGFRIELGEVQARLQAQPAVREAVVLAYEGAGGTQLVGYVVPVGPIDDLGAWRETLKAALREDLPEYMVPAHLLALDQMPLTANGKLDRKALPEPDASLLQQAYVAPQSELEHTVAAVWAQVLGLERVGMSDNFFELGGHSLLATQAMLRLREQLNLDITIKTLFTTADLAEFCQAVQALEPDFEPIHDVLAKSMEALNRLSADELEKLIS